jgi:hypothetical protein
MATNTGNYPLRLPLSLKAAVETFGKRDGTSEHQIVVGRGREGLGTGDRGDVLGAEIAGGHGFVRPGVKPERRRTPSARLHNLGGIGIVLIAAVLLAVSLADPQRSRERTRLCS